MEPGTVGDVERVARLAGIPGLVLYGDFIEQDARWLTIRRNGVAFAEAANTAGALFEVVDLPKVGIKGNSHMVMMDKNSSEVAASIQAWLEKHPALSMTTYYARGRRPPSTYQRAPEGSFAAR